MVTVEKFVSFESVQLGPVNAMIKEMVSVLNAVEEMYASDCLKR